MGFLRVGGHFEADEGATVIWNVAEGRRGRRWRWVRPGGIDGVGGACGTGGLSALLETAPDGRPTRLEVASAAGLLVLHPAHDGLEAHGNVVGPAGVRPLAFPWSPAHVFDVVDLPWVAAACLIGGLPIGGVSGGAGSVARPALLVQRDLTVTETTRPIFPVPDGLPTTGERWPLE